MSPSDVVRTGGSARHEFPQLKTYKNIIAGDKLLYTGSNRDTGPTGGCRNPPEKEI